ncbi:MAG: hypothetical protein PHF25_03275 [Candidatus Margulisbacteria bacterium]|nr:hypothetical protein [Candidatus Margulisiibacteriota bacterium]
MFWKIVSGLIIRDFDESIVDHQPEQLALVKSGAPLEFTAGSLYHLGQSLKGVFEQGAVPSEGNGVFLTRVPHKFLHFFTRKADTPFIALVKAETFNGLAREGRACLEIWGGDRAKGVIDPYPRTLEPLLIADIEEIWVEPKVWEWYQQLLRILSGSQEYSDRLNALSEKVRLVEKLSPIHGQYPDSKMLKDYLELRGLQYDIPAFRQCQDEQ